MIMFDGIMHNCNTDVEIHKHILKYGAIPKEINVSAREFAKMLMNNDLIVVSDMETGLAKYVRHGCIINISKD